MYTRKVTYTDYDGKERTETLRFNLTKAELAEMRFSVSGGMEQMLQEIIDADDQPKLIKVFKELLLKSYGVKSPDGKRFIKNQEITDEFVQSEAYSEMFMLLATNDEVAAEFVKGIIPSSVAEQIGN